VFLGSVFVSISISKGAVGTLHHEALSVDLLLAFAFLTGHNSLLPLYHMSSSIVHRTIECLSFLINKRNERLLLSPVRHPSRCDTAG